MKHLGISGGGTKIAGLFGVAEALLLEKKFKPDVISGISAGAILALPLALGKFDEIKKLVLNFKLDDFFSSSPVKENGGFTGAAIWRILTGKPYLGTQQHLESKLHAIVSEAEFLAYQTDNTKPACIIGCVDFITGGRTYCNLKQVSYADFPKLVNASSSLPIFTKGIRMKVKNKDMYLFDGGVRDHIATAYILNGQDSEFKGKITESISVFSRPEDFKVLPETFDDKNVMSILSRYVDITNVEISKNDEEQLDEICRANGIRSSKFYLPRVMKTVYDTDPNRLKKIYEEGLTEGRKYRMEPVLV
jgi:predicted patatin/cPLA2 family phospholipase